MWTIFKVFIEFVTLLLLFYVWVLWPGDMWDLSYPTRNRSHTPAMEGEVLTTESPGKSLRIFFFNYSSYHVFGLSFRSYPFHRSHLFFVFWGT